jgi:hypothetical protein
VLDVLGCGHVGWFRVGGGVGPEVLEFFGRGHCGTGGGRAEFGDTAVEEVQLVVEIYYWKDVRIGVGLMGTGDVPFTASHSFRSSPSGNLTALRRLPDPSVASAN